MTAREPGRATLDIEDSQALVAYLHATGRCVGQARVSTLTGGVSNRTVLVEPFDGTAPFVLKQALDKLRVQAEWHADPDRIHVEARALDWIGRLCGPDVVPRRLFEDRRYHLLAMTAVPRPHRTLKEVLLAGEIDHGLLTELAVILGTLHRTSTRRVSELAQDFADRRFFETLRLDPYYGYTAEQVPAARSSLHDLQADTRSVTVALVHGDYSPKNILVHNDRLVLIDHEVAHLGDPAFDVGFSLTHLLSKAHHLRSPALATAAAGYWHRYADEVRAVPWWGGLESRAVRHTLGCLLARVAGKSPLEYLDASARARQTAAVRALISVPPDTIPELIDTFCHYLDVRSQAIRPARAAPSPTSERPGEPEI